MSEIRRSESRRSAVHKPRARNPYLEGAYAPVAVERTVLDLPVIGRLPDYLDGRYLRNGPNPMAGTDPATYHWFLGAGMIHGLRILDGKVAWYRNRWVRSSSVAQALSEPIRPGPTHAGMDFAPNTHVIGHAGRTLALVEAGFLPYELDDQLETVGPCDFDGTLSGGYTAHPIRDPETGELHAVSYFWGWGNRVQYTVTGVDGRVRRSVDIEVFGNPMMHAFSLTDNHVVLYDLPVSFDLPKVAAASAAGADGVFPYSWNPDYPARVGVLPREGGAGEVVWFDVEPCYVFHPLNAFEEDGHLVLDVVRHPKMFATEHRGPNEGAPVLCRWTVDLLAGKVREEQFDDRGQEFPRIDERLAGRRHRYGYTVSFGDGGRPGAVLKHDLAGGQTITRSLGVASEPGEFVFVPAGPDAAEDEGVLMGLVYDGDTDRSDLVVLDAGILETVAIVHLPCRVPHGFHGSWIPTPG